jgi:hypothetical protein
MKAVQIKSYGDSLEVLEAADVSEPGAPGANEALLGNGLRSAGGWHS